MASVTGQGALAKKRGKTVGASNSKKKESRVPKAALVKRQTTKSILKRKPQAKDSTKPRSGTKKPEIKSAKVDNKIDKKSQTPEKSANANGCASINLKSNDELTLVAGKEVCGRKVSLWEDGSSSWRKADVVRFKPSSGHHLIRYLDRSKDSVKHEEKWIDLSKHRFQWLSPPPPDALPNPSYRKAPKRKAAVGYKIRVFWTVMGKWYLGKVLDYDVDRKTHTVKYKDGDEQNLCLRHEAVVYLSPGSPAIDKGSKVKTFAKDTVIPEKETKSVPKKSPKNRQPKKDGVEKRKNGISVSESQHLQKKQKGLKPPEQNQYTTNVAVVGSRLAIYSEKQNCFLRGIIEKYEQEGLHCILYDNGEMESVSLKCHSFRFLSPKTRSGGCTDEFLAVMKNLGAEQTKASSDVVHASGFGGSIKPAETISRRAPIKEACISWRLSIRGTDKKWYLGEVISYHAPSDRHIILYDDGEHEVLHLPSELIAWHCYTKDSKKLVFPGARNPTEKLTGESALGWRVAVFWPAERDFFRGKVSAYNSSEDTFEVNYDDGDHSTIRFGEDKIKWIFPPGTYYNPKPFLERADVYLISEEVSGAKLQHIGEDTPSGMDPKSMTKGRPKNARNKLKTPRSHATLQVQRSMGITDSMYGRIKYSSKAKQTFDIEPTFVRNISYIPMFPGVQSKSVPSPKQQSAIAVRVYLSNEVCYEATDNPDVNNLNGLIQRVRRAEESITRGIPTYLPAFAHDTKGMESFKRRSGGMGGVDSKMVVRHKIQPTQLLLGDDSESDNLNNSRANTIPKYSRFRQTKYVSLAATLPKLPPESSSASSSDEEDEQSGPFDEPERVISPRMQPISKGGKIKPSVSPTFKDSETNNAIFNPADDNVAPNAPQPIESPFGDQEAQLADDAPLNIEPPEAPMRDMGYHSESVGNLLGMSRNSSEAMLLDNGFPMAIP